MNTNCKRSTIIRFLVFFCAVLSLFIVLEDLSVVRMMAYQALRDDIQNAHLRTAILGITYLLGVFGLVVLYCHKFPAIRCFAYLWTIVTLTIFLTAKTVDDAGFTLYEARLVWVETEFIPSALQLFASDGLVPFSFSIALIVFIEWLSRAQLPKIGSFFICLVPLVALSLFAHILSSSGSRIHQFPIPYRIPLLVHYALGHQPLYYGEREEPYFSPGGAPLADHIVIIVDEGIRGDLLGVNGSSYDTTPFLDSVQSRFINYGVASAVSNLSTSANIILQSGLRPDSLPDAHLRGLRNPNVFSYMQKAGFKSFLIDSQRAPIFSHRPPNFMTRQDLERLDGHLQVRALELAEREYEADYAAIDLLVDITRRHRRSFTYLIKTGAHYPYANKYPPDQRVFTPTLEVGEIWGSRERVLNTYLNVLRWTVDGFIEALFDRFDDSDSSVLMFYTADHGASLLEETEHYGRPRRVRGHGTVSGPPAHQAMVPLMCFAFGGHGRSAAAGLFDPALVDRISAFELFPSLLFAAGYDYATIKEHYHFSIFDSEPKRERRIFISGNLFANDATLIDRRAGAVANPFSENEFTLEGRAH
jgi:glucan phosphoethanolaminetransferase (alkaline phosphatase superfamily)